ncbi:hypothetical protein F5B17DRAFT_311506 [Nemania serpens]|nr:hypothetical protein F5B17DRAFT_311506 [Nemania serpens]
MDSSLYEIWHTAPGSPFEPVIGKGSQFFVGFVLLLLGLGLTGGFAFNRSLVNLPIYGVPASLAILRNGLPILRSRGLRLETKAKIPQRNRWWTEEDVPVYRR